MAHDVFISHSSKDKTVADATCAYLETQGIRCWVAPRDIRPGANWGASIIKAIREARVMILIFSSHANASPQIKREVERAVHAGAVIIPMRIEDVLPEEDLEYFLGTPHWLDAFAPPLERHFEKLASAIQEILELPAPIPTGLPKEDAPETSAVPERVKSKGIQDVRGTEPMPAAPSGKAGGRKVGLLMALAVCAAVAIGMSITYFAEKGSGGGETARVIQAMPAPTAVPTASPTPEAASIQASATPAMPVATPATPPPAGPETATQHPWENSLGMKFVPVPGTNVLFSIWDTRVQDFQAYADATDYEQSGGINVFIVVNNYQVELDPNATWKAYDLKWELDSNASWKEPGFEQGPNHPVVGVSWNEAKAFCAWLTEKERKEGSIGENQSYRLPTYEEWCEAAGDGQYPWGDQWPPPDGAGNFFDDAAVAKLPGKGWPQVPDDDGYAFTSPVGRFKANEYGLYDMGGNVLQWCEDLYSGDQTFRVLCGSSWRDSRDVWLLSAKRFGAEPDFRDSSRGFRCVLAGASR